MAAAMLLETLLLVVRSNMPEPLERKYPHLLPERAEWWRSHAEKLASRDGGGGGSDAGTATANVGGGSKGGGGKGGGGRAREKKLQ
jgi:uncharacterized membrane protein YgcG